jgi:hypothetical protein
VGVTTLDCKREGWTAREKDGLQEKRMDCKRKGWTERGKDGQQKDISRRAQKGRQT